MTTISILIINYNAAQFIEKLIQSFYTHNSIEGYEIIIVDNNSSKDDLLILDRIELSNKLKRINLDKNVGFAKANNIAAQHASGKYLLLLNPDTLFLEDSIAKVLKFRKSLNSPCVIGIKLLNADNTDQLCRHTFPRVTDYIFQAFFLNTLFKKSRYFNRINYGCYSPDKTMQVDSIRGAFLFIEKEIYHYLNGLDENYFLFSEEVDFCYKASKKGINTYYFPGTSIIHYGGASTKLRREENSIELNKSLLYFVSKYRSPFFVRSFRIVLIISTFNRIILNFLLSFFYSNRKLYREKSHLYLVANKWLIKTALNKNSFSKID